ncbi:MAG TPA: hypothetical protein VLG66_13175 [Alphaproteobacteria bacterium]|nr:hypothetical protein [Alphaproteobacteria bacterium]
MPSRVVLPPPANDNPIPPVLRAVRLAAAAAALLALGLIAALLMR